MSDSSDSILNKVLFRPISIRNDFIQIRILENDNEYLFLTRADEAVVGVVAVDSVTRRNKAESCLSVAFLSILRMTV